MVIFSVVWNLIELIALICPYCVPKSMFQTDSSAPVESLKGPLRQDWRPTCRGGDVDDKREPSGAVLCSVWLTEKNMCLYSPQIKDNQRVLPHSWCSNKVKERVFVLRYSFLFGFTDLLWNKQDNRYQCLWLRVQNMFSSSVWIVCMFKWYPLIKKHMKISSGSWITEEDKNRIAVS